MPVDPRTGRALPYQFGEFGYPNPLQPPRLRLGGRFGSLLGLPTDERVFSDQPAGGNRARIVKRLRPDLVTGQRGGSLTLADILRAATGLGSQLFGGQIGTAGGGLADVLRSRQQVPEPVASPTAPPATGSPFVDVDETTAALEAPIASLNTPDQAVARDLARMVEEGKITMQEAAQRYRQYRFGGP